MELEQKALIEEDDNQDNPFKDIKIRGIWNFWLDFEGHTNPKQRLFAIVKNDKGTHKLPFVRGRRDKTYVSLVVYLRPNENNITLETMVDGKSIQKNLFIQYEGKIHTSNGFYIYLDGKAKAIDDTKLEKMTRKLTEWKDLVDFPTTNGYWGEPPSILIFDQPNSVYCASGGYEDRAIEMTSGYLFKYEDLTVLFGIDHEMGHKYFYRVSGLSDGKTDTDFMQNFSQLFNETLKLSAGYHLKNSSIHKRRSVIMRFKDSFYIDNDKNVSKSPIDPVGHPSSSESELFASGTAILRNNPRRFINLVERLHTQEQRDLTKAIAREIALSYRSNPNYPSGFFNTGVLDYLGIAR